ncbi:hypothetical protein DB346_20890 [Verrucomicrobia bacterium LW23]|nr:hypothetical protein DB346_20890 [Verrucomicrobia bacterium LW23]
MPGPRSGAPIFSAVGGIHALHSHATGACGRNGTSPAGGGGSAGIAAGDAGAEAGAGTEAEGVAGGFCVTCGG